MYSERMLERTLMKDVNGVCRHEATRKTIESRKALLQSGLLVDSEDLNTAFILQLIKF